MIAVKKLRDAYHAPDCVYFGPNAMLDWWIVVTKTRDSDSIEITNWDFCLRELGGENSNHVFIHRASHWACGWVEFLCIDPDHEGTREVAMDILKDLVSFPILDVYAQEALAETMHEGWIEIAGVEMPPNSEPWEDYWDWVQWCAAANADIPAEELAPESEITSESDAALNDGQLNLKGELA